MREIKFRGQDVNGEWHIGLLSISQGKKGQPERGWYISNESGMPWAYHVMPESVGQYTGTKDKFGTDIFEGDIVRRFDGEFENGKVEWNDKGRWQIYSPLEDWFYGFDQRKFEQTHQVVGNIHEHQNLLYKKSKTPSQDIAFEEGAEIEIIPHEELEERLKESPTVNVEWSFNGEKWSWKIIDNH